VVKKFFATIRSFTCSSWLSEPANPALIKKSNSGFEKLSDAFPADVFTDTRVNDFD